MISRRPKEPVAQPDRGELHHLCSEYAESTAPPHGVDELLTECPERAQAEFPCEDCGDRNTARGNRDAPQVDRVRVQPNVS
jgi:hypothetical protein